MYTHLPPPPLSLALMFSPTNTALAQCINITVVGDNLVENNETVTIPFIVSYPLDGDNFSAYVTIVDDDGKDVMTLFKQL